MSECQHQWEMVNIRFGFVVFENCFHCNKIRTYFTTDQHPHLGEKYREGDCHWSIKENAQSFRFDLKCTECGHLEEFGDLMGLMHCPGCDIGCELEPLRQQHEAERTWLIVACGFLPQGLTDPLHPVRLEVLTDYFNQRRDTSRSRIKVMPLDLVKDLTRCQGHFLFDTGMLSAEPETEKKSPF